MKKTVAIEDRTVISLLANPKALVAVPELRRVITVQEPPAGCLPCQRQKRGRKIDYAKARQILASLTGSRLMTIKALLGAGALTLLVRSGSGQRTHVTI